MGLRYRKQIKLLPGVKLNISKSGVSTSVGRPGATMNVSRRGTRATVGIPGSGLSYSTQVTSRAKRAKRVRAAASSQSLREIESRVRKEDGLSRREIRELKRIVKKDPKRLVGVPDEEIKDIIRSRIKRRNRVLTWTMLIFLIIILVKLGIEGRLF